MKNPEGKNGIPTDVMQLQHSCGYDKDDPKLKIFLSTKIGKKTNFAKNYGAQIIK